MGNIEKYYQAFCSKLITQQNFVITFFASPEKLLKCRLGPCGTAQPIYRLNGGQPTLLYYTGDLKNERATETVAETIKKRTPQLDHDTWTYLTPQIYKNFQ